MGHQKAAIIILLDQSTANDVSPAASHFWQAAMLGTYTRTFTYILFCSQDANISPQSLIHEQGQTVEMS